MKQPIPECSFFTEGQTVTSACVKRFFLLLLLLFLSGACLGAAEASIALTLIFLRRRIGVAIAVLQEASRWALPPAGRRTAMIIFPSWFLLLLLQSHQPHHFVPLLSLHHFSHADCLHIVLGSYCSVSFSKDTHTHTHTHTHSSSWAVSLTAVLKPATLHPQGNKSIKSCLLTGAAPPPTARAALRYILALWTFTFVY